MRFSNFLKTEKGGDKRKGLNNTKNSDINKKEVDLMNKKERNLLSLVIGIILILIGLFYGGVTITLIKPNYIPPSIILIVGIILTLMGSFRRW